MGQSAFYNAHALKEITFKGNVEMLGQSAFFGAPNLKKVIFEGEKLRFLAAATTVHTAFLLRATTV